MKHFPILSAFLLVVLIASGCNDSKSPTGPGNNNPTQAMPLKIGNWWAYHSEAWFGGTSPIFESDDTMRIDTSFVLDSLTWFGDKSGDLFFANGAGGVHQLSTNEGRHELLYKYPAVVGSQWFNSIDTASYRVISINASRTVPAGTYTGCYQYSVSAGEETWTEFFKAGIGSIARDALDDLGGMKIGALTQITAYHLE